MYNIGFDAKRLFNNFTGLGNYSRTLVHDLHEFYPQNRYHLFTPKTQNSQRTAPFFDQHKYQLHRAHGLKPLWRPWLMTKDLTKHKIDLYHGLSHEIPFGLTKTGIKSVVTIHDLIFKHYPRQYNRFDNLIYDFKFRYACQSADRIIAISESTKKDIIDFYQIPAAKIQVVYQTCDRIFHDDIKSAKPDICAKYKIPSEYLLYVGTIIERKNLLNIIKAMEIISDYPPLVVIGKGGAYKDDVFKYITEHNLQQKVIFLNNVDFTDFPALYHYAELFIYPSIYEGFGIPVIEALYCRTPVITSCLSSLPEAAGPDSILVNPLNVEEISLSISQVLEDSELRKRMIARGYQFVQKFGSKEITDGVMSVYRQLLK